MAWAKTAGRDHGATAVRPPVGQGPHHAGPDHSDPEKDAAGTDGDIERHERSPRGSWTVTSERTSCASTPAMTGGASSPIADAAATGEPIVDLLGQPQAEHRDRRAGRAALIDADDRNAQVPRDLDRDLGRQGAEVTEQPVLASAVATGEVGPGGRDHPQVDLAAIVVPDIAINHVGADGQADPTPRRGDDQRGSPGRKRNRSQKTRCRLR